jgi:hypothetical protein
VTAVPPAIRAWFNTRFGAERRISVHELVRLVLETPLSPADIRVNSAHSLWAPAAIAALFRGMPAASAAWVCRLEGVVERSSDAAAARAVIQYAAEARARGLVRQWSVFARRFPVGASWRLRALDGAPWTPGVVSETTRELRDAILWRALAGRAQEGVAAVLGATRPTREGCAGR